MFPSIIINIFLRAEQHARFALEFRVKILDDSEVQNSFYTKQKSQFRMRAIRRLFRGNFAPGNIESLKRGHDI